MQWMREMVKNDQRNRKQNRKKKKKWIKEKMVKNVCWTAIEPTAHTLDGLASATDSALANDKHQNKV